MSLKTDDLMTEFHSLKIENQNQNTELQSLKSENANLQNQITQLQDIVGTNPNPYHLSDEATVMDTLKRLTRQSRSSQNAKEGPQGIHGEPGVKGHIGYPGYNYMTLRTPLKLGLRQSLVKYTKLHIHIIKEKVRPCVTYITLYI